MASLCNVQLRIISGHELPKTDLFSQIDPYVTVSFRGEVVGRTATRDNNPNPVWHEDFFFEAEEDEDGLLSGVVTLDLYDEEVARDEHVGSIVLDLQTIGPDTLLNPVELPVAFKNDRRGQKLAKNARRARLAIQIVGVGRGFSAYAADLSEVDGVLLDEGSSTFLLPVPDTDDTVWTGMRFGPRSTHLLLLSTQDPKQAPNPALSYALSCSSVASLRLERVVYRKPVKLMGLKVWSELRAVNIPLGANLSKVRIVVRPQRLVDTLDPADVLVSHNYMIGMPFLAAVKELSKRGAQVDTAGQSIWIKMDSNQPQPSQLLQLDYSPAAAAEAAAAGAAIATPGSPTNGGGGGGDNGTKGGAAKFPVLRICSTNSELNRGYELAYFGGGGRSSTGPLVSVSETFKRPMEVLGGQYRLIHTLELREAFKGDILEEVGLGCYEMVKPTRTWRFGKLLDAALAGSMGEYDEGGGGGVAGGGAHGENGAGGEGGGGGFGNVRSLFACLPCLVPSRADEYLEDSKAGVHGGRGKGARGGGGGDSERRENGRVRARRDDDDEQQEEEDEVEEDEAGARGRPGRSAGGGKGGAVDAAGAGQRGGKGGSRLPGGGGGANGSMHIGERMLSAASTGARSAGPKRLVTAGSAPVGGRGGAASASAGALRGAASVGSSSERSAQLARYNSSRSKAAAAPRRSGPGMGARTASAKRLGGQRSIGRDEDEEDED